MSIKKEKTRRVSNITMTYYQKPTWPISYIFHFFISSSRCDEKKLERESKAGTRMSTPSFLSLFLFRDYYSTNFDID